MNSLKIQDCTGSVDSGTIPHVSDASITIAVTTSTPQKLHSCISQTTAFAFAFAAWNGSSFNTNT